MTRIEDQPRKRALGAVVEPGEAVHVVEVRGEDVSEGGGREKGSKNEFRVRDGGNPQQLAPA